MQLIPSLELPTPFGGTISTPPLETPPLKLPAMPDERSAKAIGHGVGEDAAMIVGLIPFVGDVLADILVDLHHAEIKNILTDAEYREFANYNKSFPTAIALARTLCFKEV